MEIGISVVVVVAAGLAVWWVQSRKRAAVLAEHWRGEVVEKVAGAGDADGTYRFVKVRLENDRTLFVRVQTPLWEALQPHDSLVKHAGSREPQRENTAT